MNIKIKLLKFANDSEKICAVATRLCRSSENIDKISRNFTKKRTKEFLGRIIPSHNHHSVLEHSSFTFGVEGVSRVLLAQLTRHRIASFSVQSQKYIGFENGFEYVVPVMIKKNKTLLKKYDNFFKNTETLYKEFLDAGIPPEDARYILPNASVTKMVITMNARELRHFFSLRCCNRSQWEIRKMARLMLNLVRKEAALLFSDAGPDCVRKGCNEVFPCGKPWKKCK